MEDIQIVDLYWQRDETAIEKTDEKYGKLCYRLANNILQQNEDSEECVNDTYMKIWNSIPNDRPNYFSAYICTITKRLALDKMRYLKRNRRYSPYDVSIDELRDIVSGRETPEDELMARMAIKSVNHFLEGLSTRNRNVFIRRYWYYDSVEDISEMFNMKQNTVATILFRTRKALKEYLRKDGYEL